MAADSTRETHTHDVVVIGAGGAGLRAAIEASAQGCSVALVCKSLLGKAHTVMAEGGMAAALSNVRTEDNWKVHFRDTMRGGKMLGQWRMAQLKANRDGSRGAGRVTLQTVMPVTTAPAMAVRRATCHTEVRSSATPVAVMLPPGSAKIS